MVVWQNSFDGETLTLVSEDLDGPGTSGEWGDPIVNLRNSADVSHVRYGDRAYGGRASLMLGSDAAESGNHGDVQLTQPVGEWSVSFYMYRTGGGWIRFLQDGRVNVSDLYLDYASGAHFVGWTELDTAATDQMHDRWVRCEASQGAEECTWRLWWAEPDSTGTPDYEITVESAATTGYLFVQGGGSEAEHPPAYIDQVRVGEGEWLGPWPTHQVLTAQASLDVSSGAQVRADLAGDGIVAVDSLPLSSSAQIRRGGRMDATAELPVAASSGITRHAGVDAIGELGELGAGAQIRRGGRFGASASLPLSSTARMRSQFRPTFPPRITTELRLDGEWVDISGDVRATEPLVITRGRADEASQADPSTCALLLDNRAGRYSPHNPLSPYYGKLGRNTPIRVRVGPLPDPGEEVLADSFDRTLTGGWGTADSGQEWQVITGPDGAHSVTGGQADIALSSPGDRYVVYAAADVADFEATFSARLDTPPRGQATGAIYLRLMAHATPSGDHLDGHGLSLAWRVDAGAGTRIAPDITRFRGGQSAAVTQVGAPIPDMRYTPGEWVRVRAQAVGPELRIRVWSEGETEPAVWHAQAHNDEFPEGGFGFMGTILADADATSTPATVSVRDLQVRSLWEVEQPDVIRFAGEVSSWPARWDTAGVDVRAPIEASGILRRLGQGSAPVRSVLRRAIPTYIPVAYWPLEEGATARYANSPVAGVQPMRVAGLHFAEDDSLGVSRALPTVGEVGATIAGPIPYVEDVDGWEVNFMLHIPEEPDIPADPDGEYELFTVESTELRATMQLLNLGTSDPDIGFRWRLFDHDGDEIDGMIFSLATISPKPWGGWRRLCIRGENTATGSDVSVRWYASGSTGAPTVPRLPHTGPAGAPSAIMANVDPVFEGMAVGHVSAWGATLITAYQRPFDGWEKESSRRRLSRMSTDFGVPILISGAADEQLGSEEEGTFLDVVGQAMESDLGAPGEDRASLALTYTGRDRMYNAEPALVLDYKGGEISPPMEPEDDDQALRNDVEVQRSSGIAVQVEDTDGPLGVGRVGRYDESVTLSLATDSQADDQAGWRLHLGTVDELRWPTIHLNLANPRMSARVEDVLALDAGDRVRILNPPPWTQERSLDLIVQGYEEQLGLYEWEITLTCTPASPWQVGQIGEESTEVPPSAPMRADTAGCELAGDLDETETAVRVRTIRGPEWVTTAAHPDCLPFDITIDGEVIRVLESDDGSDGAQWFTVERSTTGVVKPHSAGAAVRLAYSATAAL